MNTCPLVLALPAVLLAIACNTGLHPTKTGHPTTATATDDTGAAPDEDTGTARDSEEPPRTDTGTQDAATDEDTGETPDPEPSFAECFAEIGGGSGGAGPDYSPMSPVIGSHCSGTDHQDIEGVERVVFIGDSVTVGSPPVDLSSLESLLDPGVYYRNQLADSLALRFSLTAPGLLWQSVNPFEGTSFVAHSGDFSHCAQWGARADDLMVDNDQVLDCFPASERHKKTLVIMTMGGNDLKSLTEGFMAGEDTEDLWNQTFDFMSLIRQTVEWFSPERFPAGVFVVLTNLYEFTDGTGDVTSCPTAGLAGLGEAITDPALEEMVLWSMEEFMSVSVDNGTDMLFLLENFCGHGYNRNDPSGRCYRGPGAELWFDLTCIHPSVAGHAVMADMFMDVINE